jgi:hypothetical protein
LVDVDLPQMQIRTLLIEVSIHRRRVEDVSEAGRGQEDGLARE